MHVLERALPERLGRDFRWLWGAFATGNLGDGVLLAAGPLLVASITLEPFPIAMAAFAQRAPWLVFGLVAGAVIDRVDRRRLLLVANLARGVAVGLLALFVASGDVGLPAIYGAFFLIGTIETFSDNAGGTLVATTVPKAHLGLANARLQGTGILANQMAGPPFGALLFGLGLAVPFGATAVAFLAAATLVRRIERPDPPAPRDGDSSVRRDVVEGLRWLRGHDAMRTLTLLIAVFNVTFGAAFSVWVLYALEILGLDEVGFGVLLSASAVGGLVGSGVFGALERRMSYATMLRIGLVIETGTHLGLALTDEAVVAGAIMVLFGVHAVVWGTLSHTIRQRAVPSGLLGRVTSVYLLGVFAPLLLGQVIGGLVAERFGVLGPFWFAFVGAGVTTVLVWRSIAMVADAGEVD